MAGTGRQADSGSLLSTVISLALKYGPTLFNTFFGGDGAPQQNTDRIEELEIKVTSIFYSKVSLILVIWKNQLWIFKDLGPFHLLFTFVLWHQWHNLVNGWHKKMWKTCEMDGFKVCVIEVILKRASESTTLNFQRMEYQGKIYVFVSFSFFGSVP